uniref:Transcription factor JunB n=1 Tax=Geotrypetes seraphini TaxID=260995 RepID=A0A6P8PFW5_GEOSA|nr:transcription factor jun-B [Geotrypetes seraphini]
MCTKMEQPFYHDDASAFLGGYGRADAGPLKALAGLKGFFGADSLKLAAPELERLIIQSSDGLVTTSPAPYPYARGVTEEQEGFADGFVKALDDLHKLNQPAPPNVSLGACARRPEPPPVYAALSGYSPAPAYPTATISYLPFKEEPQTVPEASPPLSPIDMEDQERIKVERKRLRNRLAATKCRKRKLERIARLEDKVKALKAENAGLAGTAGALRQQVALLKRKVLGHVQHGCQLLQAL